MPGWIYKITQIENNKIIYVGSTFGDYFCLRKCSHLKPSSLETNKHQNLYGYIKDNGGWEKFKIEIIQEFVSKEETRTAEVNEIQRLKPLCNIHHKKTLEEKKAELREYYRNYWANNEQKRLERNLKIAERSVTRCQMHIECPCGGRYTLQNKTNHYNRQIHKQYEANLKREES